MTEKWYTREKMVILQATSKNGITLNCTIKSEDDLEVGLNYLRTMILDKEELELGDIPYKIASVIIGKPIEELTKKEIEFVNRSADMGDYTLLTQLGRLYMLEKEIK